MRTIARRVVIVFAMAGAMLVATATLASAHPLGNFTVNQYAGLRVRPDRVDIDYVVDMAEIPTFQARGTIDRDHDDTISPGEAGAYGRERCAALTRGIDLRVDGQRATITEQGSTATLPVGQAGLPTLRLECSYRIPVQRSEAHRVTFEDTNLNGRIGWHEITAVGDGATLEHATVPERSISGRLTSYPTDRLQSPLDTRTAELSYRAGGPSAAPVHTATGSVVRGFDALTGSFASSVARRDLTAGLALVALAIGLALGAIHAFSPGHGKTVMAAYLVGERGKLRDGLLIGVAIAATHTLGVLVLGGALTASQQLAPESLYPYLSVASGVCFVALGATLLLGALRRRRLGAGLLHDHHHQDHHHHDHDDGHDHGHRHSHSHSHGHATPGMSRRNLLTLGFAGGLVPTPTAVVVLLGATAIGRAWFGVALVVAYGIGMAATLVAAGLLLSWARRRFEIRSRSERLLKLAAVMPVLTAVVVTTSGLFLIARAATSI